MKVKTLAFAILILLSLTGFSQTQVSLSMKKGYKFKSYYSLMNGEVKNVADTTWDLAFTTTGRGSTIRTHSNSIVYIYPGGIEDWETLDITNMLGDSENKNTWEIAYNSDTIWSNGAFSHGSGGQNKDGTYKQGWGYYDINTHHVIGDRIFVLKATDGIYRKVLIKSLKSGIYTFKYADLDNKNQKTVTIDKSDYQIKDDQNKTIKWKNFTYYSMTNHKILNDEPYSTEWDFVFTKYQHYLESSFYTGYYGVTGVLLNNEVSVSKVEKVSAITKAEPKEYSSKINAIGYKWKIYDYDAGNYIMEDSLVYFINDVSGNIWKVTFTKFDKETGDIGFTKERIVDAPNTGLSEIQNVQSFSIYPTPSNGNNVNILFRAKEISSYEISIIDISGNTVYQESIDGEDGLNTIQLSNPTLTQGIYIIQLSSNNTFNIAKLLVH